MLSKAVGAEGAASVVCGRKDLSEAGEFLQRFPHPAPSSASLQPALSSLDII